MNLTDWISAGASVINVLIVWKIAQLTERYAKATDNILKANQKSVQLTERYAQATDNILTSNQESVETMRQSVETMRQASYGTTFVWASKLLSSKEILLCRRKVMEELPNYTLNGLEVNFCEKEGAIPKGSFGALLKSAMESR